MFLKSIILPRVVKLLTGAECGLADFPGSICQRVFLFFLEGERVVVSSHSFCSLSLIQDAYYLSATAKHCTGDVHDGLPATQRVGSTVSSSTEKPDVLRSSPKITGNLNSGMADSESSCPSSTLPSHPLLAPRGAQVEKIRDVRCYHRLGTVFPQSSYVEA